MSVFHRLAGRRRLLQYAVGRQRTHVSRVRHFYAQPEVVEYVLCVIYILMNQVRHRNGLAVTGINVEAHLQREAKQGHHAENSGEVKPQIFAFKLADKFLCRHFQWSLFP